MCAAGIEKAAAGADAQVEDPLEESYPFALARGGASFYGGQGKDGDPVMMDPSGVTSYGFDGGRIFALWGELDACTCQGLAERLVGPPGSLIVVDLCQVTFIDSSGLGAIHAARRTAIVDGGNLVVSRPSPMVHGVLEITGLDMWVTEWNSEWSNASRLGCAS
jgi:anti-anti-sigma factor